jgi:caspase domain-containing protein/WD40 domain-containing protein
MCFTLPHTKGRPLRPAGARLSHLLGAALVFLVLARGALTAPGEPGSPTQPEPAGARPELDVQMGHTGQVYSVAFSRDGQTLATASDDLTIKLWNPNSGELLHVLAVGVSRYKNPKLDLKYAARDAVAFVGLWQATEGRLYRKVHVTQLTDGQATVAGIRAAMGKLVAAARLGDSVSLFLSGHGVEAGGGNYHFAAYETDASTAARLRTTALPWTALRETLASVKAKRVFLFLDACHSGNALGAQQSSNERLAELLVKGAYVLVFASSRGSEYSYELERLQQGAFTAALLEGLGEGKADVEVAGRKDGAITAEELLLYLRARVPQLTEGRQTPACPLLWDFGGGFVLARAR